MVNRLCVLFLLIIVTLNGCASPVEVVQTTAPATETPYPPPVTATVDAETATAQPVDWFPVKAELRHAKAFQVEYYPNYKVVTILQPWRDAETTFTYLLVQRGTPLPQGIAADQIIEIPVRSIAALSTTHLPYLDELGVVDTLKAVGNVQYINTPSVIEHIQKGYAQGVGNGPDINLEMLIEINPELVTTLALGNPRKDDFQLIMEKGLKVVVVSDFMEETPLGRAEWVKFMALFYNREEQAEQIFSQIEDRYEQMRGLVLNGINRPTVIMGFEINGQWNMPGGRSYQAAYIRDAGGDYLWSDDESTGRIPLSFEAVFEKGWQAEYWFNQSVSWLTADDILAADARYETFKAFQLGNVYNNNARLNETGGNDYNESGHAHPELILADLISILHPELLPDHQLIYYRPLMPKRN